MKSFEDALSLAYLSIAKIALDLTLLLIMCLSDQLPPVLHVMTNRTRKIAANQNAQSQISARLLDFACFGAQSRPQPRHLFGGIILSSVGRRP
jgi:hypothetical protein